MAELLTKSFKDVHYDLEQESVFLNKNHNVQDFKVKSEFLKNLGFTKSIATKLYSSIADNYKVIEDYKKRYNGIYKFILAPQLERICEKYNLYLRNTEYFLGDIPEKNIKDIINFKIFIEDLPISDSQQKSFYEFSSRLNRSGNILEDAFSFASRNTSQIGKESINTANFKEYGLQSLIQIASIKSLFSEEAFKTSEERIIGTTQIEPKHQVDLDPIVVCRTKHGYLIVTAWGDESNDELVVNTNLN